MTRPKRPTTSKGATNSGAAPSKGSRGHAPKKMTAQGRGGATRETTRLAREPGSDRSQSTGSQSTGSQSNNGTPVAKTERYSERPQSSGTASSSGAARRYGSASATGDKKATGRSATKHTTTGTFRKAPPKLDRQKGMPELKRVQLDAPAPNTVFIDRDGNRLTFQDSNLRRVAAEILTEKRKAWRYRPFGFPLFTDRGHEQSFHFDFYIYDYEDSVIRLILVIPFESREVWDKVGRFKRQYPMYTYELWTPEKLAQLSGPRGNLGF